MTIDRVQEVELEHKSAQNKIYELFITAVTLHALINTFLILFVPKPPAIQQVLIVVDWYICAIFFVDFLRSLYKAEDKKRYFFRWGWLDLLGSVPNLVIFRLFRIARTLRTYRTVRGTRFRFKDIPRVIRAERAESTLMGTIIAVLVIVTIGASAIVFVESGVPNTEIHTGDDAIWWAFTTISTVGYGDIVPVTESGRGIGVVMMLLGVTVFGVFTSYLSTTFFEQRSQQYEDARNAELRAEFREELEEIKAMLRDIQRAQT